MLPNTTIPEPTDFFFPRWHSNPLFRGSYSNMPAAYVTAHQDNLRATVDKYLWFAGEASNVKYYGEEKDVFFTVERVSLIQNHRIPARRVL